MTKLRVVPMALGLGVTWGIGIMLLGWVSAAGWGTKLVEVLSSLYLGYTSTFLGGVIGGLWGFVDAFFAGLVVSLLYNAFASGKHSEHIHIFNQAEQPVH